MREKKYIVAAVLLLIVPISCINLEGVETILGDQDLKPYVLSMLNQLDPLASVDPFHVLQGQGLEINNYTLAINYELEKWDLDIPDYFSEDQLLTIAHIEQYGDPFGLLGSVLSNLDPDGELEDRRRLNTILHKIIAPLTPVLEVSDVCFQQSLGYFASLLRLEPWAIFMLDSTGKIPDGVLADTSTICDLLDYVVPNQGNCKNNPLLKSLFERFVIPRGNTIGMGSFEGCLLVEAKRNKSDHLQWNDFKGQYAFLKLVPYYGDENSTFVQERKLEKGFLDPHMAILPPIIGDLLEALEHWPPSEPELLTLADFIREVYISMVKLRWAQCVPSGCSAEDIQSNYFQLYKEYGATTELTALETEGTQEEIRDLSQGGTIAVITIYSIIAFCMFLGVLVELYQRFFPSKDILTAKAKEPFVFTLLKCFSPYNNGRKILNSTVSPGSGHLTCLSGIRVLSMTWVVLGHTYMIVSVTLHTNAKSVIDVYTARSSTAGFEVILNALPSVDTFFFLSGLLVSYFSFIELEKKRFNLALFYIHRYIRLTIPFALAIAFVATLEYHIGSGPFWSYMDIYVSNCRNNWWINLLYLHNFVNPSEICIGQTWYMANDMQYFWVSPLIFIPMFKWGRGDKNYWGLWWWVVWMVAATVVPIAIVIHYDLPPSHIFFTANSSIDGFRMDQYFYIRPYIRMQPYLIGMMLGYILWRTKDKEIKIHWFTNIIGWLTAIATGIGVVFGLHSLRLTTTFYECSASVFESAFYNGFHKIGWALALSWVVFACVKGYGGIVNSFLSWGLFLPLARLTYMVYLFHLDFLDMYFMSLTYTIEASHLLAVYYIIGLVSMIFAIAFVATLVIEAPFMNLEKLILGKLLRPTKNQVEKIVETDNMIIEEEIKEEIKEESDSAVGSDISEDSLKKNDISD